MTKEILYTFLMNYFQLLTSTISGIFAVTFVFLFSFFCVHVFRLAKLGRKYQKQTQKTNDSPTSATPNATPNPQTTNESPKEKPSQSKAEEPIYYIVERKKRTKSSFSKPKQIRFK